MTPEKFILKNILDGLRPEQNITVSEWADKYRILSNVASAEPGRWRTDRFPFLREIMDSLSANSTYETVVVSKGAQLGLTEAGNCWIGYIIHHAPGPTLAVLPTVDMAKDNSKTRLDPLIEESPVLRERVKEARSRDSGNTTLLKEFNGGFIAMVGSNAPGPMRSKPIRYLFLDEVDAYPGDVGSEGDPISLARARTRTFSRRKIFMISTPTIKGRSRIDREFLETDQRRFYVPCPHCNFYQILVWQQIRWIDKNPRTAHYSCINCEAKIYNHEKNIMLQKGYWKPTEPMGFSNKVGFHISSLYSPVGFYSWEDAVSEWLSAQKNSQALKTFINTVLGETWEEKGDAPEWEKLIAKKSGYISGEIPMDVSLLVAGADVQNDRIEVEIVGYGKNKKSWSIDYFVFMGDPSQPDVWKNIDDILSRTYRHESGAELRIEAMAIDSGFKTSSVYEFTRKYSKSRVFAVKGLDSQKVIISGPKILDIRHSDGKRISRGARLWTVGVGTVKTELFDFLKQDNSDSHGFCSFPEDYTEEYFRQLTAEQLVSRVKKNGNVEYEWIKTRERNEALDCRVYARAAASLYGIDRWNESHWDILQKNQGIGDKNIEIKTEVEIKKRPIVRRTFSKGIRV